jgi:hypothetical protein
MLELMSDSDIEREEDAEQYEEKTEDGDDVSDYIEEVQSGGECISDEG